MGGQAFAKSGPNGSPINVPRMPPDVYAKMSNTIQEKLAVIFRNVVIPRDAPGKQDFGDIDFLVEGAVSSWTPASLMGALGAAYHINNGGTQSYAVPYPESPDQYVQVDVEISPGNGTPDSTALFEWTHFMKSDADLMQIIGICHRSLGLTCNDKGLHVRVEDIEPYDKKKALLFLTRDPHVAVEFYGLDFAKYSHGFVNTNALFEWVTQGRFFARRLFENREEKANDRARQRKRPMYSRFVEEYIPTHPDVGATGDAWTREQVLNLALDAFGVRDKYNLMIQEHDLRERELAIWQNIRDLLPLEGKSLSVALKGLRRWVDFDHGQAFITSAPFLENQPIWTLQMGSEEETLDWVRENWEKVKALEKARAAAAKEAGKSQSTS